jgi:uncharacterized membrane protein
MKKITNTLKVIGLILLQFYLYPPPGFTQSSSATASSSAFSTTNLLNLEKEVLEILKVKCNICHKKQNPFKVFSAKNINKHAPKIYKQVFVYQRMPKGNTIKLTDQEYQVLKDWLTSKNIYQ